MSGSQDCCSSILLTLIPKMSGSQKSCSMSAQELGWIVLWWYMMDTNETVGREFLPESRLIESFHEYSIQVPRLGWTSAGAKDCAVALACPSNYLMSRMEGRIGEFLKTIRKFDLSL